MPRSKTLLFPEYLYITKDSAGYYQVQEGPTDTAFEETAPCALYRLAEVGQVQVSRVFEGKGSKTFRKEKQ